MKQAFILFLMVFHGTVAHSQNADGLAEPEGQSPFALIGGELSFGMMQMSQSNEFAVDGPSISLGIAAKVDTVQSAPLYLEWNSTFLQGTGSSGTVMHQGADPVLVAAGSSPVGSIEVVTSSDALGVSAGAVAQITDSTGHIATINSSAFSPYAPETSVSQFAFSQTSSGGAFAALSTNGETGLGAAYGTIFDDTGFILISTGEEGGTVITRTDTERIDFENHSLSLSAGFPLNDQWTFTPSFTPMYRGFDRTTNTMTIVKTDDGLEGVSTIPDIALGETASLDSNFFGATVGATFSREIRNNWQISIGADVGLLGYEANADIFENVTIANANTRIPGSRLSLDGASGIGRISVGLTHAGPSGAIINLSAYVDYMSDVPYIASQTLAEPALANDGSAVSVLTGGETYRVHSMREKDMITSGISLSFVMFF